MSDGGDRDLIGDLIGEVARTLNIAISPDDPIIAVLLLNREILRRYAEDTIAPASAAIRTATEGAIRQVEQVAEAQAHWVEQETLKDRTNFLAQQKEQWDQWRQDIEGLIAAQNAALENILVRVGGLTAELVKKELVSVVRSLPPGLTQGTPADGGGKVGFSTASAWGIVAAVVLVALTIGAAVVSFWLKS